MDFGDILDEWEKQTAKPAGKKAIQAQKRAEQLKTEQGQKTHGQAALEGAEQGETVQEGLKQAQKPGSKASAKKVDPLTAWLRVHGVEDKDRLAPDMELSDTELRQRERKRLINKAPDAVLDLHGLTRDEAWDRLGLFFAQAQRHGAEKVLIIHGKGNHSEGEAVLKRTTLQYIEQCPYAGMHGHPSAEGGGSGATWVLLKKDITARDR
uniref:DNA mismatch repair protein MutS n=1 Tax=Gracilinema caldarium TaxID=215591 RepID=A0A7C3EGZ3_9SPIR